MDHWRPWLRLQLTPGLGRVALIQLINHYKTPQNALDAATRPWPNLPGLRGTLASMVPEESAPVIEKAIEILAGMHAWIKTLWDDDYPQALRRIPDPPAMLYGCGPLPSIPALAIVGTRRPTAFGRRFTEQLAEEIAAAKVVVVSGLARGIDTAAHFGALRSGGHTIAVLGCGIDQIYPPENRALFRQIMEQDALISEYPPGTEPLPGHFPGRNRIISGLSRGTLVVEASRDSGSLITAEFALDQGREVLAVPGGVDHDTSYGPNLLIKQGAHPVTEATEILEILGLGRGNTEPSNTKEETCPLLTEPAGALLARLDLTPRHCDELAGESGLTAMELSAILLHLELQGYVEKLPGGRYIRGRKAP